MTQAAPVFDRGRLAVALVLLLAPFFAFPPDFISKALLDGGDDLLANLPQLVYSGRKLLEGELLWVPELWMGHPLLAEPEFAALYLPKLLLLLGTPVVAYAAYLILHYLAAELGAYLYVRSLGISRLGALFAALAYAFAGFMIGHRAHTMYVCAGAWAPFVLLLFDRAAERGGWKNYLFAALAFAMLPFCGAVQLTVYLAATIGALAALRSVFERHARRVWSAGLCLVPALLVSAAQLVPSYAFSQQLATETRASYEIAVMHSFHPLLLPTLMLPLPPLDPELYSRAGVVVAAAAAVSLARIRTAPAAVRAWAIVAGVSLLLMLGRYFPPLARLTHELPLIGVLRGPARHNFELGLALMVLGGYGLDAARRAGAGKLVHWLLAAGGVVLLTWSGVWLAEHDRIGDAGATALLGGVKPTVAVAAAVAFAIWMIALGTRRVRRARWLWACVAILPLLETAWAMRIEAWSNRTALGVIEAARSALPAPPKTVRLISVSLHRGSADVLAGNSVLFHPGVESLQGYSSIAYSAEHRVLDLDMHGQPNAYGELAFSILPSVFGVTHVVLPAAACNSTRFWLPGTEALCGRGEARAGESNGQASRAVAEGELACAALATDTTFAYRLQARARAEAADELPASFAFGWGPGWSKRLELAIPGPALGTRAVQLTQPVRLAEAPGWVVVLFQNPRATKVEFFDAGLYVQREASIASLSALSAGELRLEQVERSGEALRLSPGGNTARVERTVRWPRTERPAPGVTVLEVVARAPSRSADLLVDLYGEGYDADEADLVVAGDALGPEWRTFSKQISAVGLPDEFRLRGLLRGSSSVEIREARLALRADEQVYPYPARPLRHRAGVRHEDGRVTLNAETATGDGMHLPVRAFEVLLDAQAAAPLEAAVEFGLDAAANYKQRRTWQIASNAFHARARIHRIALLPPDVRDMKLFVRVRGNQPLQVNELSATDACTLRGYTKPRRLANGLSLYENPRALPRAYAVGRTLRADDPEAVRRALLDFAPEDLGTRVVVERPLPGGLQPGVVESAEFRQRANEIVVRSDAGPTLLVVNQRFDPDWRATIDGAPAEMFRVNGLVRGLVVPRGRHRVHMFYETPAAVWAGAGLALLGLMAAAIVAPAVHRRRFG